MASSYPAGIQWQRYPACHYCQVGDGQPCLNVRNGKERVTPHPGRNGDFTADPTRRKKARTMTGAQYSKWRRNQLALNGGSVLNRRTVRVGSGRRMQALLWAGWFAFEIEQRLQQYGCKQRAEFLARRDCVSDATFRAVKRVFSELWDKQPPTTSPARRKQARTMARKNGWVSALAWDDIDDPEELPETGERDRQLSSAEKMAELDYLLSVGESYELSLKRLGVSDKTARTYRARAAA